MIDDTVRRIEARLSEANLPEATRADLRALLGELRGELAALSAKDADRARSVAGFAEVSAHEASRAESDPDLLDLSVRGLASSVRELEATHPTLARVVDQLCLLLSNTGI